MKEEDASSLRSRVVDVLRAAIDKEHVGLVEVRRRGNSEPDFDGESFVEAVEDAIDRWDEERSILSPGRPVVVTMTYAQAESLGIVLCGCGHPPNNHFDHSTRPCAHCGCKVMTPFVRLRERP